MSMSHGEQVTARSCEPRAGGMVTIKPESRMMTHHIDGHADRIAPELGRFRQGGLERPLTAAQARHVHSHSQIVVNVTTQSHDSRRYTQRGGHRHRHRHKYKHRRRHRHRHRHKRGHGHMHRHRHRHRPQTQTQSQPQVQSQPHQNHGTWNDHPPAAQLPHIAMTRVPPTCDATHRSSACISKPCGKVDTHGCRFPAATLWDVTICSHTGSTLGVEDSCQRWSDHDC